MYTKLNDIAKHINSGLQNVERLIAESSGSVCHTELDGEIAEIHLEDEIEASIDPEKNEDGPLKSPQLRGDDSQYLINKEECISSTVSSEEE